MFENYLIQPELCRIAGVEAICDQTIRVGEVDNRTYRDNRSCRPAGVLVSRQTPVVGLVYSDQRHRFGLRLKGIVQAGPGRGKRWASSLRSVLVEELADLPCPRVGTASGYQARHGAAWVWLGLVWLARATPR